MINLDRLIELPFSPKEVTDNKLAKFIEDHIKRSSNHAAILNVDYISETQNALDEYKKLLSEIVELVQKRSENSKTITSSISIIKDFFRRIGNLLVFVYTKNSEEYNNLFSNGLSEISSLNNGSLKNMVLRVKEFLSNRKGEDTFGKLYEQFIEINKPLENLLLEQTSLHEKLASLTNDKNNLKEKLIRCFARNTYYGYIKCFENPSIVCKLYNQKMINPRISNSN